MKIRPGLTKMLIAVSVALIVIVGFHISPAAGAQLPPTAQTTYGPGTYALRLSTAAQCAADFMLYGHAGPNEVATSPALVALPPGQPFTLHVGLADPTYLTASYGLVGSTDRRVDGYVQTHLVDAHMPPTVQTGVGAAELVSIGDCTIQTANVGLAGSQVVKASTGNKVDHRQPTPSALLTEAMQGLGPCIAYSQGRTTNDRFAVCVTRADGTFVAHVFRDANYRPTDWLRGGGPIGVPTCATYAFFAARGWVVTAQQAGHVFGTPEQVAEAKMATGATFVLQPVNPC